MTPKAARSRYGPSWPSLRYARSRGPAGPCAARHAPGPTWPVGPAGNFPPRRRTRPRGAGRCRSPFFFQVQGDAALVAGVQRPPRRDASTLLAHCRHRVAGRRVVTSTIVPRPGSASSRVQNGAATKMADLKNAQAQQGAVRSSFGHVLIHARPSYGNRSPSRPIGWGPSRSTWIQNQRTFATFL